jgi:hypothetical protein
MGLPLQRTDSGNPTKHTFSAGNWFFDLLAAIIFPLLAEISTLLLICLNCGGGLMPALVQ